MLVLRIQRHRVPSRTPYNIRDPLGRHTMTADAIESFNCVHKIKNSTDDLFLFVPLIKLVHYTISLENFLLFLA